LCFADTVPVEINTAAYLKLAQVEHGEMKQPGRGGLLIENNQSDFWLLFSILYNNQDVIRIAGH